MPHPPTLQALQHDEAEKTNIADPNYENNDGVNKDCDGVKPLNKNLQKIYQAIVNKPDIITTELMEIFNISESTVTRSTRKLKELGFIKRDGADKNGKWIILK